ncbi:SRPBCC family protein [Paraburkholderia sp. SOS3]|uniref:SRPBCC family protein n=1 Tax=Paraburkholderia sp. SOS3 TaxID=1926494 RepID=UPI000947853B|nr:SRPBCC family protein [Paraburkholderia sp. SOS3]APR38973.1 carbon monoxide dehydrogenase [Paraburkholderia sp. SOS3]
MEIEQSFTVAYPLDDVWTSFHDTPGIVACLPGATLSAPPDNGALKLAMTVKLGPIVASFAGDGEMTLDENERRGSVSGGGVDRKSASRVKGVAAFALHAISPEQTRVDVKVDYTIAGTLAQFSRGGIVKELATRLTDAFAQNLKAKLDAQQHHAGAQSETQNTAPDAIAPVADTLETADAEPTPDAVRTRAESHIAQIADAPHASTTAANPSASSNRAAAPSAVTPSATPPANAPLDLGNLFWKMLWSRIRGWLRPGVGSR